jgi:hypothetical protein
LSDQDNLGDFLESAGISADTPTPDVPTPETPTPDLSRDPETGRFAPKAGDPPATTEAQPAIQAAEPKTPPQVPLDAVTELRGQNRELKAMIQQLQQQITAPKPQEPPQQKTSFWDDPEGYLEQKLQSVAPRDDGTIRQVSEMLAVQQFGADTVDAAGRAFLEEAQRNPALRYEYEKIMASRHPYAELVSWHKRHQTMSRIGDNPDAFVEAELEKKLADPAFAGKVLERLRGQAATQPPITQVPPSLSRIPGGANVAPDGPTDDAGIFAYATKGMRR